MYVDHAATTPVRPEVLAAMLPFFSEEWGNPSSVVSVGAEVLKARRGGDAASISDVLRPQYRYSLTKGDQDI